jgi:hypothetical protein
MSVWLGWTFVSNPSEAVLKDTHVGTLRKIIVVEIQRINPKSKKTLARRAAPNT